jgi:hypothetical protein
VRGSLVLKPRSVWQTPVMRALEKWCWAEVVEANTDLHMEHWLVIVKMLITDLRLWPYPFENTLCLHSAAREFATEGHLLPSMSRMSY